MAARASTNSSWRAAGTRTRVWATQAWPLFISPATLTPAATAAGSASSSTMAADLPPSSRLTRLRSWPQRGRDLAAGGGGAGERDLVDAGVGDEQLADLAAAGQDADHARRAGRARRRARPGAARRAASRGPA